MADSNYAEVQISPSEALNVLKNIKKVPLKFKSEYPFKEVIVLDETHSLPEAQNLKSMLDKKEVPFSKANTDMLQISAKEESNNSKDILVKRAPNSAETTPLVALTVPLYQYWYMHHAYRKELEKIEKEHGVTFSAEVSVTFRPTHSASSDSMSKAPENFQKLLQECFGNFSYATFHHTHMDSDIVKEIQRNIQSEEQRMMLSISASNCLFLGPKKITDMINRKFGLVEGAEAARLESQFKDKSSKMQIGDSVFQQNWTSLVMDTKDLPTQLEMDKVHWDLIKISYDGQLAQLEKKYGVSFHPEKHQNNLTIKVRAQSKIGQCTNLESHALRALMQLYQKLATATFTCELKIPKDANIVAPIVEKLQSQHYCVIAVDVYGSWRLVGLPEHLGPAIAEIEKTLQKNVFAEKMKKLIGYSSDIPHTSGIKWDNTPSLGQEAVGGQDWKVGIHFRVKDDSDTGFNGESGERVKENSTTDSKGAHGEEEQCPICMEIFTNEKQLKCGHKFCSECIKRAVEAMGSICPVCKEVFGKMEGNQPDGTMYVKKHRESLPGYPNSGIIEINYEMPGGTQTLWLPRSQLPEKSER
ncbi:E3 ubiquitin-protein ligase DTX3L isoform X2 [Myxocyprinus asiaticus]|uniref:E3 ubiquitin-protein ligase DTX3L isoform X2 n=1 Tax=Myxocyprinus asiaticus TaxID=70543 RepID=UPI0022234B36|nr:E3 ubiquitin-protein ligase DTX3L isoform X2 [Myxocyprinus asiaticus]